MMLWNTRFTSDYFRKRAEEVRAQAETMQSAEARATMFRMARTYDQLAAGEEQDGLVITGGNKGAGHEREQDTRCG